MKKDSFLPDDYDVPAEGGSFMKFEDGDNRFRILTPPVIGWQGWKGNKPFNREGVEKNIADDEVDVDEKFGTGKPKISHFWAFIVWDYQADQISVLQLTQKTIMKAIQEYSKDEDWGNPTEYDLTVTKRKEGDFIKYSVKPSPHKDVKEAIQEAFDESELDLHEIFFADREEDGDDEDEDEDETPRNKGGKSSKTSKKK